MHGNVFRHRNDFFVWGGEHQDCACRVRKIFQKTQDTSESLLITNMHSTPSHTQTPHSSESLPDLSHLCGGSQMVLTSPTAQLCKRLRLAFITWCIADIALQHNTYMCTMGMAHIMNLGGSDVGRTQHGAVIIISTFVYVLCLPLLFLQVFDFLEFFKITCLCLYL